MTRLVKRFKVTFWLSNLVYYCLLCCVPVYPNVRATISVTLVIYYPAGGPVAWPELSP